ncbi:hypothetical protein AJ80_04269 [Polytolypa hystricis UAMH7299]|uniref:Uncharacterized protein n=1 Tax=Polytolypa hystricis (strain UAMH7299) TaxID=1447883 RepID=A0A2B7YDJ4_POLH7|nr:hypothetical protein AJ80_04269 [Polytolypa hystricis UAMH7299]
MDPSINHNNISNLPAAAAEHPQASRGGAVGAPQLSASTPQTASSTSTMRNIPLSEPTPHQSSSSYYSSSAAAIPTVVSSAQSPNRPSQTSQTPNRPNLNPATTAAGMLPNSAAPHPQHQLQHPQHQHEEKRDSPAAAVAATNYATNSANASAPHQAQAHAQTPVQVQVGGAPARIYLNEKLVPYLLEGMKVLAKEQ